MGGREDARQGGHASTAAALEFWTLLYGDLVGPERQIVLFGPGLGCAWHADLEEASRQIDRFPFFGVCLQSPERMRYCALRDKKDPDPSKRRGYAESAIVVPGFWSDTDWVGEGKGKPYPPDRPAVEGLHRELEFGPPTLEVFSGGGLHAYWLFEEPYEICTTDELAAISGHLAGFHAHLFTKAEEHGWALDSTQDLARVLRIPGTVNEKYGVDVVCGAASERRYEPQAIEVFVPRPSIKSPGATGRGGDAGQLALADAARSFAALREGDERRARGEPVISADACAPQQKLEILINLDEPFRRAWRRQLKHDDQSRYDFTLAQVALRFGWSDQEVTDAIVQHRREGGAKEKLRPDYFWRTIEKARAVPTEVAEASERLRELDVPRGTSEISSVEESPPAENAASVPPTADPAADRTLVLEHLSSALGLPPLAEVRCYGGETPMYSLVDAAGLEVELGSAAAVLNQAHVAAKVLDAWRVGFTRVKGPIWIKYAESIVRASVAVDTGEEAGPHSQIRALLRVYLAGRTLVERGDLENESEADRWYEATYVQGMAVRLPDGGGAAITIPSFARFIAKEGYRLDAVELGRKFKQIGTNPIRVRAKNAASGTFHRARYHDLSDAGIDFDV